MIKQPTPNKTASVPLDFSGLYIGVVRKSDESGVFVEIPQITAGFSFGPCNVVANNIQVVLTEQNAVSSTSKTSGSAVTSVSGGNGTPVSTTSGTFITSVTDNTAQYVTDVVVNRVRPPVGAKVVCGFLNNTFDEVVVFGSIL